MSCVTISTAGGFLSVTNFREDHFLLRLFLGLSLVQQAEEILEAKTNVQLQEKQRTRAYLHATILTSINQQGRGGWIREYSRQDGVNSGDASCEELENG